MQWNRTRDSLPNPGEEILIRYGGIFNLAVFDAGLQAFVLRDGTTFSIHLPNIQWLRLVTP